MSDFATWVEKNKSLWTRVYDEVIAPDFEKEWKKREESHQNELKKRDDNQQLLFNHINEQIVKHAQVVEENERLESELQQRAESAAPSTNLEDDADPASTGISEEQHRNLTNKYEDLSKRYQDLLQKVKYLERKNNAVMQKNRDMKDSVRAWQQYADRQKSRQRPERATRAVDEASKVSRNPQSDEIPPHLPSSPRSVSSIATPYQRAQQSRASPTPINVLAVDEVDEDVELPGEHAQSSSGAATPTGPTVVSSNEQQGVANSEIPVDTRLGRTRSHHVEATGAPSSSQTTVDETNDQLNRRSQAVHLDDEDDLPQIVSERSLKRKRGQQSRIEVYTGRYSDGTPAKPHRVKDEPLSSPPPAVHVLMRTETIDLDDTAANEPVVSSVPRRPSIHANATGTIRHQRSGSAPFSQHLPSLQTVQQQSGAHQRMSDIGAKLEVASAEARALSEPMAQHYNEQVLQPLDPNAVAQVSERTPNKRLKTVTTRRAGYDSLAESGEVPPLVGENELRLPPSAARARLQKLRNAKDPQTPVNRLQYHPTTGSPLVKQEPSPSSPATTASLAPSPLDLRTSRKSASSRHPVQQDEIIPEGRPVWSMRAPEKRPINNSRNTTPSSKLLRLREKPVKELKVHDFKPNPACNQGYSYAFSEAVRKRGERMCLPGCTNPQCCGSHFRRLAEALEPLPAAQEEILLEDYLGDAYNSVISTQMSPEERAELVLQARTKKMAKDNGKHKQAYEGRRTPPGFWRVDFPTTQEQEDDRGRAKEQEMKVVQERWLEAQQKGGRWIFRDE